MAPTALHLLADQDAELERLQAQARVWEPAGRALLADLDLPTDARVLDVGCGALGWLRALGERVPDGTVVGTDVDEQLLDAAGAACRDAGLNRIQLVRDDLFHSTLPPRMFDLVHARFQLAPLGRAAEQLAAYRRLLKPGGLLVLEEPDTRSWTFSPYAPATTHLVGRVAQALRTVGGDLDMGRRLAGLLRAGHLSPHVRTHAIGLEAGHPYLRLPLQLADALEGRLEDVLGRDGLRSLRRDATAELDAAERTGTTFTLVQAWARTPS
jgi:ubiquinone/menaquinone biosynthesis C-methylase UbiE